MTLHLIAKAGYTSLTPAMEAGTCLEHIQTVSILKREIDGCLVFRADMDMSVEGVYRIDVDEETGIYSLNAIALS